MLYPEWAKSSDSLAAVPMVHDHEAIAERIDRLEQADAEGVETLQELLYGLYALISVHCSRRTSSSPPSTLHRRSQSCPQAHGDTRLGTRMNTLISHRPPSPCPRPDLRVESAGIPPR